MAFVGRFDMEGYSHAKLNTLTTSLGGTTAKSVTQKTTHLIYTVKNADPMSNAWITAKNKDIPIVQLQWIVECEKQQKKVNEVPYQANASPAAVAAYKKEADAAAPAVNGTQTDVVTNRKKRAASAKADDNGSDDEPEPPKSKKAKETKTKAKTNGKKNTEVKDEPDEEMEEEKPVAEGQFLKKTGASIPVDSCWMSPGYQVHVGDDGMIWDASLNQSNSANNNNKFYVLQVSPHHQPCNSEGSNFVDSSPTKVKHVQGLVQMGSCWRKRAER